jgi:rhomboid protease GluP
MPITIGLMVIIVLVFFLEVSRGGATDPNVLFALGAVDGGLFARGEYWRLLTAMFLHGGVMHLGFNLWALYQLGGLFEMMFGSQRFILTWIAAGLIGSITSALFISPGSVSVGASGAIFGILGALIPAVWRSPVFRHQPWARGLVQQLMLWAGINVFIGFTFPMIDNAAHLGGFGAGLLLGMIPHNVAPPPPGRVTIEGDDYHVRPDDER